MIKLRFSSLSHMWPWPILVIMFRPFGFTAPKNLNYLAFQSLNLERTRSKLFQKRAVRTKFEPTFFIKPTCGSWAENIIIYKKLSLKIRLSLLLLQHQVNNVFFFFWFLRKFSLCLVSKEVFFCLVSNEVFSLFGF